MENFNKDDIRSFIYLLIYLIVMTGIAFLFLK